MYRSFLFLVFVLFVFPSDHVMSQAGFPQQQPRPTSSTRIEIERNPDATSLYEEGVKRLELGEISESVERFQRAITLDPEFADAYSALGRAFFKLRQWENASGNFRRAMALKAKERDLLQRNRPRRSKVDQPSNSPPVTEQARPSVNGPTPLAPAPAVEPIPPKPTTIQPPEVDTAQSRSADVNPSQEKPPDTNLPAYPGDVVTIQAKTTQFVFVGGEVKLPGEREYRRGLTLTQAIIAAGGAKPKGKLAEIERKDGQGAAVKTRFDLREIESGKAADPVVRPGDRIMVLR
jgi:tetratricopeptide (TPR) repeat protein